MITVKKIFNLIAACCFALSKKRCRFKGEADFDKESLSKQLFMVSESMSL